MRVFDDTGVVTEPVVEWSALLGALNAMRKGEASVRLPVHWTGIAGKVADAFNEDVEQNANMTHELARLRQVEGKEGQLKQRARLDGARGYWGESVDSINSHIDDQVHTTREVARVLGEVAQGDQRKSM